MGAGGTGAGLAVEGQLPEVVLVAVIILATEDEQGAAARQPHRIMSATRRGRFPLSWEFGPASGDSVENPDVVDAAVSGLAAENEGASAFVVPDH